MADVLTPYTPPNGVYPAPNENIVNNTIANFFVTFLEWSLMIASVVALIYIILAGIRYIQSGGDTKKAQEARASLVAAVIGLIIVVCAYFIFRIALGIGAAVNEVPTTSVTL